MVTVLASTRPSHAYLDPGTGSIILQSLLASIAVALGAIRMYWQQCKAFVLRLMRIEKKADGTGPAESSSDPR